MRSIAKQNFVPFDHAFHSIRNISFHPREYCCLLIGVENEKGIVSWKGCAFQRMEIIGGTNR